MDINTTDAAKSLSDAIATSQKARLTASYAGADNILIIWGIVWLIGFLGNEIKPDWLHSLILWAALLAGGMLATILCAKNSPVESSLNKKIGLMWLTTYALAFVICVLFAPFIKEFNTPEAYAFAKRFSALNAIVPMFAYILMGIWTDAILAWIGIAVIALTFIGLFLAPNFFIWMAIAGGGTLICAGIYMRRKWIKQ